MISTPTCPSSWNARIRLQRDRAPDVDVGRGDVDPELRPAAGGPSFSFASSPPLGQHVDGVSA
jgi:hypothetical protein